MTNSFYLNAVSRFERFIAHLSVPLYRNGYALMLNSGISAVLGVAFWAVAAHNYSPTVVGLNSAAISTMISLAFFAQLDMTNGLNRFLPTAGKMTGRMLIVVYAMCVTLAFLVSTVFVWGMENWSSDLAQMKNIPWFGASFVAATCFGRSLRCKMGHWSVCAKPHGFPSKTAFFHYPN